MTTVRRARANRKNARSSTGPKTRRGKARSAQNARRHGLSIPVLLDPKWSNEVRALARIITGKDRNPEHQEFARRVAAAQIDVVRARRVRIDLINATVDSFTKRHPNFPVTPEKVRYTSHQLGFDSPLPIALMSILLRCREEEVFGPTLAVLLLRLRKLDRYEKGALSLRKFAMRSLVESRYPHEDVQHLHLIRKY